MEVRSTSWMTTLNQVALGVLRWAWTSSRCSNSSRMGLGLFLFIGGPWCD